uniref:Putative secreted protein n=1 Tax=Anopheles triannulatus TaxID=58253 RepID=A0A2M4B104_9DIPT
MTTFLLVITRLVLFFALSRLCACESGVLLQCELVLRDSRHKRQTIAARKILQHCVRRHQRQPHQHGGGGFYGGGRTRSGPGRRRAGKRVGKGQLHRWRRLSIGVRRAGGQ